MKAAFNEARKQLCERPNDSSALYQLAVAFRQSGQINRAIELMLQAVIMEEGNVEFHCELASSLLQSKRYSEACCAFRQVLRIKPDHISALSGLGICCLNQREYELAVGCLRKSVAIDPSNPRNLANLAQALSLSRCFCEGAEYARRAIALDQSAGVAYMALAISLMGVGEFQDGIAVLTDLLNRDPSNVQACTLSAINYNMNNFDDKAKLFSERALKLRPLFSDAHFELAIHALATGDWALGWQEFEWRPSGLNIQKVTRQHQPFESETWHGEKITNKTLLVYGEQGLGDIIQFLRFLPELAKFNCRLLLLVPMSLVRLARGLSEVCDVAWDVSAVPLHDYNIPICSIPRVLGTTLETLPARVPYLFTNGKIPLPPSLGSGSEIKVGFVWATKRLDHFDGRNIPLGTFATLFDLPFVEFYSLQVNEYSSELDDYRRRYRIYDLKDNIEDMCDTAGIIQQLDVIISIDTSVAHLAGSLGAQAWVLLPFSASWRWLRADATKGWHKASPWYPTIRLFRCPRPNDWEHVVSDVKAELLNVADSIRRGRAVSLQSQHENARSAVSLCLNGDRVQ